MGTKEKNEKMEELYLRDIMWSFERAYINSALEHHNGKRIKTAKSLGFSRFTLNDKLDRSYTDLGLIVEYEPGVTLEEARERFRKLISSGLIEFLKEEGLIETNSD